MDLVICLDLLRQLAETLKYAHERRLSHRSPSPQKVLVLDRDSARPKLKIFDWRNGTPDALRSTRTSRSQAAPTLTTLGLSGGDQTAVGCWQSKREAQHVEDSGCCRCASLPQGIASDALTLDQALALLARAQGAAGGRSAAGRERGWLRQEYGKILLCQWNNKR